MGKHLGKHKSFGKPKPAKKSKPEAHFEVHHYAGTVGYNVTGWLFKNKDPVNEAVIGMMAGAGNAVCALVFAEKDTGEKKKGSSMMTISAAHRESLMKLMANLHSTHPHFVRCIIPNEIKKSGHIDAPLVMHQLNCNGMLEGIRICMLGLPNKVPHADFMSRYSIISPKTFSDLANDAKACASKALVEVGLDADEFRCGHTKIMFRAGRLSKLEEIREGALTKIVLKMQCTARVVLMKLSKYNEVTMTGSINDGDIVFGGLELPESDVNGDTSLTLGLQLVKNPGVLEGSLARLGRFLLELLDGSLVDTSALVDQVTSGGGLAGVDVSDDDNVDVSLFLTHC